MLPPCPDCGLRPRYLVGGKWTTLEKVLQMRFPVASSVRPQHARWCLSEDNRHRHFLRSLR